MARLASRQSLHLRRAAVATARGQVGALLGCTTTVAAVIDDRRAEEYQPAGRVAGLDADVDAVLGVPRDGAAPDDDRAVGLNAVVTVAGDRRIRHRKRSHVITVDAHLLAARHAYVRKGDTNNTRQVYAGDATEIVPSTQITTALGRNARDRLRLGIVRQIHVRERDV